MRNKITAVVVTYNRLELLKKCIYALNEQTYPLDSIIIINNDSKDGTKEWLDAQINLDIIHQENVGGAGGFSRGIEYAYNKGFDWIWAMDDDVNPTSDCLEKLTQNIANNVGILVPTRKQNGTYFLSETIKFNLKNILKPFKIKQVTLNEINRNNPFSIEGMTFEGPLISRKLIDKIGLPNKDYFILYDDTDYSYRATKNHYKVLMVPNAIMNKEIIRSITNINKDTKWKLFYHIRNTTYFNVVYGENITIKYIRPLFVTIKYSIFFCKNILFNTKYKFNDILFFWKSLYFGYKKKLGKFY